MEPASHTLKLLRSPPEGSWSRLQAELDRHGPPMIAMTRDDAAVTFRAETWEPILRARVEEAVEAMWGHVEASRTFAAVGQARAPGGHTVGHKRQPAREPEVT